MSENTPPPPPFRPMTEQEEAQLLAEYGVEGPYDALLDVQAHSRFVSDYGDRDIFLTGVSDGDEDDESGSPRGKGNEAGTQLDRMTRDDLLHLNMEAAVIKYTSAFSALTSTAFTTNVTAAMNSALADEGAGDRSSASRSGGAAGAAPSTSSGPDDAAGKKYLDILRAGKKQEEVAFLLCSGSGGTGTVQQKLAHKALGDLSTQNKKEGLGADAEDEVVGAADHLLQQAATYFAKAEEARQAAVDLHHAATADVGGTHSEVDSAAGDEDDDDDDDEDEEEDEVLLRARQLVQRFGKLQAECASEEKEEEYDSTVEAERTRSADARPPPAPELDPGWEKDLPPILQSVEALAPLQVPALTAATELQAPLLFPLYSYEVEPTKEVKGVDVEWNAFFQEQETATVPPLVGVAEVAAGEVDADNVSSATLSLNAIHLEVSSSAPTHEDAAGITKAVSTTQQRSNSVLRDEQQKNILAQIQTMEERDRKLEDQTKAQMKAIYENNHRRISAAQRQKERDEKGIVTLQTFGAKVQALLPAKDNSAATAAPVTPSEARFPTTTTKATTAASSAAPVVLAEATQTVKTIQEKAALELFIIQREAMERKLLREEDRRVHAYLDYLAHQREEIAERIAKCLAECDTAYMALIHAELVAYQDLCDTELRNRTLANQAVQLREVQATAQLASNVFVEHSLVARNIEQLESSEFADCVRRELQDRTALLNEEARRREAQLQAEKERHTERVRRFNEQRKAMLNHVGSAVKSAACSEVTVNKGSCSPAASRWELALLQGTMLRRERSDYLAWLRQTHKVYQATLTDLNEALQRTKLRAGMNGAAAEGLGSPLSSRPGTAATASSPAPRRDSADGGGDEKGSDTTPLVLNASRFRALQSTALHAAQEDVLRAAQYLHSLSFALEGIQAVDFADVAKLNIAVSGMRNAAGGASRQRLSGGADAPRTASHWLGERFIAVCNLVQELDLGSNKMKVFPLADSLLCFAALRRLSVSDNKLGALLFQQQQQQQQQMQQQQRDDATARRRVGSALRSIAAAQEHALSSRSCLTHLNISSNQLLDIEAVGRCLFSSLVELEAQANQISSLLPLLTCTLLQKVHANRNKLQIVEGLSELHLLQELNVSNNYIQSLDALGGHNVLLSKLCASENQMLSLFPPAAGGPTRCLPFLTELYIGHNALKELREDTFAWMPFLAHLNAESNQLTRVTGLQLCTRLVTVRLGHNLLADVSALYPLLTCTRLASLDVSHNPLMAEDTEEDETSCALLSSLFPCLLELNNNPVAQPAPGAATAKTQTSATTSNENAATEAFSAGEAAKWAVACMGGSFSRSYQLLWLSSVWDRYCDTQRTALESQQTFGRRKFYIAEGVEEQLRERRVSSGQTFFPSLCNVSRDVEERGRRDRLLLLRQHLNNMPATDRSTCVYEQTNVHVRSSGYYYRALLEKERRAKKTICEWIGGLVLVRRARALRKTLDAERKQSEAYRREMAARKIQPIWRGAALRSRLHRLLHPGGDEDDDGQYEKVELHFDDFDDSTDRISALLTKAMNVAAAANPLNNFDVPVAFPVSTAGGTGTGAGARSTFHVASGDMAARPDSAPFPTKKQGNKRLAALDGEAGRPASSTQSVNDAAPSGAAEQWGADVYSQLQKKKRKMNGVRNQHIMQEFQKDPLNAKRLRESKK